MGGNWSAERGIKRPHDSSDSESSIRDANDSPELYTPKRKRFQSTAQYIVRKLFEEGTDSDVTITALGKTWNLHKLYLSQCKYFESMFSGKWVESGQPHVVIQITDDNINVEALTTALKSLYTDNIVVKPIDAVGVLAAATFLQLEPLIDHCRSVMKTCITARTAPVFLAASQVYGLIDVGKLCRQWLLRNLMVPKNAVMLMEISEELLITLMDNTDLWIMQVEVDIYCMIKKWMFTQLNPTWTGSSEQLYKDASDYFLRQFELTGQYFLERVEGRRFIPLFHRVKWMYIVNDTSCLQSLEKDHIVHSEWLNPVFTFCWLEHLQMEQALDFGPRDLAEDEFYMWAMRCGRVLQSEQEYHWRWLGFSYGLDLLFTLRERTLSISRNCGGRQRFAGSLSQQQVRHVMIRVKLSSVKKKDLGTVLTTGIRNLTLTTNDSEVPLLTLTPHMKFPLQVSMLLLYFSPSASLPSPILNIPPLPVDTPMPASSTQCALTSSPTPSSVTQAARCATASASATMPTARPLSAATPHPAPAMPLSIPRVVTAVRGTDSQNQGSSGSSRQGDSSTLQGHSGASRILTLALKSSQNTGRLSSQGQGVSSSASTPLVISSQPSRLCEAGSHHCGNFTQGGGDVASAARPPQVRSSLSSFQNHGSGAQGPGGSMSSAVSSRQNDSGCQRQGGSEVRPSQSSAQRERDRSPLTYRADVERNQQNVEQDSQRDGQNDDGGGTASHEDETQNTEEDSERDVDSAENHSVGGDRSNDDAKSEAQGSENDSHPDDHATDSDTCQVSARTAKLTKKRSGDSYANPRLTMSMPACHVSLPVCSTLPAPSCSSGNLGSSETIVPMSGSSRITCSRSEPCQVSARTAKLTKKRSGDSYANPRLSMSMPACHVCLPVCSTMPAPSCSSGNLGADTAGPSSHQEAGPRPVSKSLMDLQWHSGEPVSSGFSDLLVAPGADKSLNVQTSGESTQSLSDDQGSLDSHHEPPSAVPNRLRRSVRVHSRLSSRF